MTPQETKALLDLLDRIATALEGKDKDVAVEIVNRFAEVYRRLDSIVRRDTEHGTKIYSISTTNLVDSIVEIKKTHAKIAGEILSIYQKK